MFLDADAAFKDVDKFLGSVMGRLSLWQAADRDGRPEHSCMQKEGTSKSRPVSLERKTSRTESGELLLNDRLPGIRMIGKR